jgi:hypothetical protein
MSERPQIYIHKFWTEYKPETVRKEIVGNDGKTKEVYEPTGQLRGVDMVAYSPIGSLQKTMITEAVSRLSCVVPMEGRAAQNPAVQMAHIRWNAIRPQYEAWKKGTELKVDGTPLAAWPGVTPEQAQLFRMKGVRSVEDVAALTDTHKQSMGIPGLHDIVENAKRFLTSQDKGAVARALEQKDAEIESLKEQMAELAKMTQELMSKQDAPKRKPKAEAVAAA